jgi:hypothetical protein
MWGHGKRSGKNEEQEEEATTAAGHLARVPEAEKGLNADSDSDLETEGALGQRVTGAAGLTLTLKASPA